MKRRILALVFALMLVYAGGLDAGAESKNVFRKNTHAEMNKSVKNGQ